MAHEFVVLSALRPTTADLTKAFAAADPRAAPQHDPAPVITLRDVAGRVLLAVDGPLLVHTPGEVARLLGEAVELAEPVWWTSLRCPPQEDATDAAARAAAELAARTGGQVWIGFPT